MSDSIPYLGSKISLISKSEIRYEGILYTIDAQESIIALAKVQSYGTEDRPVEIPVPAKNEVYEYIIFRGTDIKKIEVCETPKQSLTGGLHNDPAIVGLQVQQHAGPSVASSYPATSFTRQPLGPIGSVGNVGGYYGTYGQPLGQQGLSSTGGFSMGASQPSELSSGMGSSVGVGVEQVPAGGSQPIPAPIGAPPQSGHSTHAHQQDVLVGSRSSTPAARKSPVSDAGVQVSPPSPQQQDKKRGNLPMNQRPQGQERQSREGGQNNQARRGQDSGSYYNQGQSGQYQQQGPRNNQGSGGGGYQGGYYQGQYQGQQYNQYSGARGNVGRGRAPRRSSQPRGRGSVYNQGNRQRQDQQLFDKEFDFEQANEEFEELRTQLAKTKITENGEKKDEKKDDSGHETATTGDESEDSASSVYYDKAKSFFDSISCEALERSKGRSQRPDWRQERKINVQTFGVATARRGYYPRGRGGYYNRGGYYRNYNQGYYRGNSGSGYRGSRGSGNGISNNAGYSRGGSQNGSVNGTMGNATSNSYASAVRSSTAAK